MSDPTHGADEELTVSSDQLDADPTVSAGGAGVHTRHVETIPESIAGYRILGKLGEGGMGVVYEAEQQQPRRRVALKVIRGGEVVDDNRVRMFQREVETLARLKHPNIGAIYESGRTEEGQPYFAMELVAGPTLDDFLRARRRRSIPASSDSACGSSRSSARRSTTPTSGA